MTSPTAPRPAAAWRPLAKPGLVPLRPLGVGEVLGAAFQVFRRNPRTTFGTALLVQVVVLVATVVVTGGTAALAFLRVDSVLPEDREAATAGAVAVTLASFLVPLVLSLVASAVLQGLFVLETSQQVLGRRLRLGGLWRLARGRLLALVGWTLLLSAGGTVVVALVTGVVVAGVVVGGPAGTVAAVLLALVLGLGAVVLAAWLLTRTAFVPSALVLERVSLGTALRRSWQLTQRSFWRTLGVLLLVAVMIQVAAQVVTAPVSFLLPVLLGVLAPTGSEDPTAMVAVAVVAYLVTIVLSSVVGAIGSVVQSATTALLYVDLRTRREGLDLELTRHVELRDRGATDLPDPWRTPDDRPVDHGAPGPWTGPGGPTWGPPTGGPPPASGGWGPPGPRP